MGEPEEVDDMRACLRRYLIDWVLFAVVASGAAACAAAETPPPLSWDEFRAQASREQDTGIYLINGDEPAESLDELADAYRRYRADADRGPAAVEQTLVVNQSGGEDDRWPADEAEHITYCVSEESFDSDHGRVVRALAAAARSWESAARVNFIHVSGQDADCTRSNDQVVFDVRQVCSGEYLARSFFPSSSQRGRELLIDCSAFDDIEPYTLAGIVRHELGHTLGFRHEHTRPEAGTCFEDDDWRPLTEYDAASVMHYPQCGGTNQGDLVLTDLDRAGAARLYP